MHINNTHPGTVTEVQMPLILEICEHPMKTFDSSSCPLCTEWETLLADNARGFGRHLARHLQQIALESLPLAIDGLEVKITGPVSESSSSVSGESSNEEDATNQQDNSTLAITQGEGSRMELSRAVENGLVAVVTELLENGADAEARGADGRTLLSCAASNGHVAVVQLLLEKGAYVDTIDSEYGWTPLSWAAVNGHESVARILVDHGADINEALRTQGIGTSGAHNEGNREALKLLFKKVGSGVQSASKAAVLTERVGMTYDNNQWFCYCGEAAKWYVSTRKGSFGNKCRFQSVYPQVNSISSSCVCSHTMPSIWRASVPVLPLGKRRAVRARSLPAGKFSSASTATYPAHC